MPDPKLSVLVRAYAESAVAYLGAKFQKNANFTDPSIADLEWSLNLLWLHLPIGKPSNEDLGKMAMTLGSYLGEIYRRNHGGEWGTEGEVVALRTLTGTVCYPWNRVMKRLTNGEEDNVLHWYQLLVSYGAPESSNRRATPPPLPPSGTAENRKQT